MASASQVQWNIIGPKGSPKDPCMLSCSSLLNGVEGPYLKQSVICWQDKQTDLQASYIVEPYTKYKGIEGNLDGVIYTQVQVQPSCNPQWGLTTDDTQADLWSYKGVSATIGATCHSQCVADPLHPSHSPFHPAPPSSPSKMSSPIILWIAVGGVFGFLILVIILLAVRK